MTANFSDLTANLTADPATRHAAARVAFLLEQPAGAAVRYAVPAAPGLGDDAVVFLDGFQTPTELRYADHSVGQGAGRAAFFLRVPRENYDPLFPEDLDADRDLLAEERTAAAVTTALGDWAARLGRADVAFVHDPSLAPAAAIGNAIQADWPDAVSLQD